MITFSKRLLLGYHKAKLNTLTLFSKRHAAKFVFKAFCTPHFFGKTTFHPPLIFHKAEKKYLQIEGFMVNGFYWKNTHSTEKTVLICHGFESCSYKFDRYVCELLHAGFNVLAFDAIAHGNSEGKTITSLQYRDTIVEIQKQFGPLYGIIGHSLAGLAGSFAIEVIQDASIKLAVIAPAVEISTVIDIYFTKLNINRSIHNDFNELIASIADRPIEWYSLNRVVRSVQNPVLWIHDKMDRICLYSDSEPTRNLQLPHVQFITTNGLGHRKIYHDATTIKSVVSFLLNRDK